MTSRNEQEQWVARPYDSAEYLDTPEAWEEYLNATCEDGTASEIAYALGVIARAQNMTKSWPRRRDCRGRRSTRH